MMKRPAFRQRFRRRSFPGIPDLPVNDDLSEPVRGFFAGEEGILPRLRA